VIPVWGVTMVKDEVDVIEQTLRHMHAEGLAGVVALDNRSTDGTRETMIVLAEELSASDVKMRTWLHIVEDPEVGYWQSAKMTAAARQAMSLGASWVIPFDADEIWYDPLGRPLAEAIPQLGDEANMLTADLYDHRCTGLDPEPVEEDDPFTRMGWRHVAALPLPKVVVRPKHLHVIHAGNHGATLVGVPTVSRPGLEVRHFPWRGERQAVRKVWNGSAAYRATTLPEGTGAHWREMGRVLEEQGERGVVAWFREAFYFEHPAEAGLIYDPAPIRVEVEP
jgi:Glycosyl transferase family 2